ncbi:MAG: hypothetical protein HOQ05_00615 [Corynebacteriales bacterium]|nr:hypothetical protein [Mycobacteriales bacterium]
MAQIGLSEHRPVALIIPLARESLKYLPAAMESVDRQKPVGKILLVPGEDGASEVERYVSSDIYPSRLSRITQILVTADSTDLNQAYKRNLALSTIDPDAFPFTATFDGDDQYVVSGEIIEGKEVNEGGLETLLRLIEKTSHPETGQPVSWVLSDFWRNEDGILTPDRPQGPWENNFVTPENLRKFGHKEFPFGPPSAIFRTEALSSHGGWSAFAMAEDRDLYWSLAHRNISIVDAMLMKMRRSQYDKPASLVPDLLTQIQKYVSEGPPRISASSAP